MAHAPTIFRLNTSRLRQSETTYQLFKLLGLNCQARCIGNGFSSSTGGADNRISYLLNVVRDSISGCGLFFCRCGNLLNLNLHFIDSRKNVFQCLAGLVGTGDVLFNFMFTFTHGPYRFVRILLNTFNHDTDISCGPGSPVSQGPHLVGNNSKTTPLLAGPCRFNGSIKSQQIGLIGNIFNSTYNITDLLRSDSKRLYCF